MPRDFTITQISSSNEQIDKTASAPYIPVLLSIPGVISLREKDLPYKLTKG